MADEGRINSANIILPIAIPVDEYVELKLRLDIAMQALRAYADRRNWVAGYDQSTTDVFIEDGNGYQIAEQALSRLK